MAKLRQADVPVAVIDPDSGVFGGEYAKQASFNGHTDLAGRAAIGKSNGKASKIVPVLLESNYFFYRVFLQDRIPLLALPAPSLLVNESYSSLMGI